MLKRSLLITLLVGSLAASLPSLAQAAEKPCSPAKPAATPITITSSSIGTLQISWQIGASSPTRERILYSSEKEPLVKVQSNEAGLENGTARSTNLTQLREGEPYKVLLVLVYHSCVEEKPEGNDLGSGYSLAPIVHWYKCLVEGCTTSERFPEGEHVSVNFYGTTVLTTVQGTQKGNYVSCNKLDAAGIVENPLGGGTGNQTITSFETKECSQSGYCASGETPEILIKNLPLVTDTFYAATGYRFEHMNMGFVVQCNGRAVARMVVPPHGPPLLGYLSNGRYEVASPPNLDLDDGPGNGGENTEYAKHYETQYGNGGNLELEGSGGTQVIQPKAYWYYLGYESFLNDVIPTNAP